MARNSASDDQFTKKLKAIIEVNLADENFGVNELAVKTGLSRSQIHRKLKSICNKSVSQFIREIRLEKAKELLINENLTVSEIAFKVGFSSPSYFIKCFREFYGYSPGRIVNGDAVVNESDQVKQPGKKRLRVIFIYAFSVTILVFFLIQVFKPLPFQKRGPKISIALLPAGCDMPDSCQLNVLNQIIQNVINNLCIAKIDVKPWQAVKQYANSDIPPSKIASELKAKYIVTSGVTDIVNNKIQLNVNLIEGQGNTQITTNTVNLDYSNAAFTVQSLTKVLLNQLNVKIAPVLYDRINKAITNNPTALKSYWEGLDKFNQWLWDKKSGYDNLVKAKKLFETAVKYDNEFSAAYAQLAITYYKMRESGMDNGTFAGEITKNTEKAFNLDSLNDLCLVSKSFDYLTKGENNKAVLYLERALEYNPNSLMALRELCRIYRGCSGCPTFFNNEKQLEYALRVVNSEIFANSRDSITKYDYYELSVAFRNSGFLEESLIYINKAIEIDSDYVVGIGEKSQILKDMKGYQYSIGLLKDCIQKDSTYLQALNWLWITYYMMHDFDTAYYYLERAEKIVSGSSLEFFAGRISLMLSKKGEYEKAKELQEKYFESAKNFQGSLKSYYLTGYYSLNGNLKDAFKQMKIYLKEGNYINWVISVFEDDPIFDNIRNQPEFKRILSRLKRNFWKNHERIKANLKKKGLL